MGQGSGGIVEHKFLADLSNSNGKEVQVCDHFECILQAETKSNGLYPSFLKTMVSILKEPPLTQQRYLIRHFYSGPVC